LLAASGFRGFRAPHTQAIILTRTDIMTTLVDLRHWRIEAVPARLDPREAPCPAPAPSVPAQVGEAEIIAFPRITHALLRRPRKSLRRRAASAPADPIV
jgi:hypothetical protein